MREEMRLVSIGWPLSDALTFCASMRRDRMDLERFVKAQEDDYRGSNNGVRLL